jgi:hypothetical protein
MDAAMPPHDPAPALWASQALDVARRRLPDAAGETLLEEARLILGENPALSTDDRVAAIAELALLASRAA